MEAGTDGNSGLGLSPRVRGNPVGGWDPDGVDGSIPACAGEPRRRRRGRLWSMVYPRVCGGTAWRKMRAPFGPGLSPRVRGNL